MLDDYGNPNALLVQHQLKGNLRKEEKKGREDR